MFKKEYLIHNNKNQTYYSKVKVYTLKIITKKKECLNKFF